MQNTRLTISIFLIFVSIFQISFGAEIEEIEKTEKTQIDQNRIVEISISGTFTETDSLFLFTPTQPKTVRGLTDQLRKINRSNNIKIVIARIGPIEIGWAKLHEIRNELIKIRENGKQLICYLDSADTAEYLLATAADRIILTPNGLISLIGLRAEITFYKGLLDKLDIEADMLTIGKFKSAVEPFVRDQMSEANRTAMIAVLNDLHQIQIEMISDRKKINSEKAKRLIDLGPFTADEAKKNGLVDDLIYYDQLIDEIVKPPFTLVKIRSDQQKSNAPDLSTFSGMMKLFSMFAPPPKNVRKSQKPKIAIIYAVGPIVLEISEFPIGGSEVITAKSITDALRTAREDETIKAIVLRVDSPGGSALASDLIWRGVQLAKEIKPVIVSMSDLAASGGYYISAAATEIIAQPGTLTGSIGVLGGKLNLRGFYDKIGITKEIIAIGENAKINSDYSNFSDSERRKISTMMQTIYDEFVQKVADGRGKTYDEIHAIAQGRIWTGTKAKEIGLVDRLGGLHLAIHAFVGGDNKVVLEVTWRGTHTGPMQTPDGEIPATGKSMEMRVCQIFEIEDGKVKSMRQYFDMMTMMQQLGLVG